MAAPLGNKNAAGPRDKVLSDALRKQLIQFEDAEVKQGEAANKIAKNVIALALKNDPWAIQFIADRVDGKPTQAVEHSGRVITESLGEEQARVMAEEYLASVRNRMGAGESDRLHQGDEAGLSTGETPPTNRPSP